METIQNKSESRTFLKLKTTTWYWIVAILITIFSMIYQKITGPTYSKKVKTVLNNKVYKFKLIRSWGGSEDCKLKFNVPDKSIEGSVFYKKYKVDTNWAEVKMQRKGDVLFALLPHQPPAGKLSYYIKFKTNTEENYLQKDEPVIIRFKGAVPKEILIPHIIFMILTMLFSSVAAIYAIFRHNKYRLIGYTAYAFLIIGGLILGPIVQKYAFNELWAGIPFGWDLTDNKTLIAFIAWTIAIILDYKKKRPFAFVLATIVVFLIFSIPHSVMGSEYNYEKGTIEQSDL